MLSVDGHCVLFPARPSWFAELTPCGPLSQRKVPAVRLRPTLRFQITLICNL